MTRTLFTAPVIYTGDPPSAGSTAMIVDAGRIMWVGGADDAPRPVPRSRIAVPAGTIVPGFVDSHQHAGSMLWLSNWVDCRDCRSPQAVVARLGPHAIRGPEGTWLVGWGYRAAEAEGGRHVSRADLDALSGDRPVLVIESSFHQGTASSAALAAVGFGRDTPRRWGGEIERDRRGEPTGMVWERAFGILDHAARRAELAAVGSSWGELAAAALAGLLTQGITHAGEALVPPSDLARFPSHPMPLGLTLMPCSERSFFATPWDALDGPPTGEGDAALGIGPVKLVADGAERAAMSFPVPKALAQTWTVLRRAAAGGDPAGIRLMLNARAKLQGGRLASGTLLYPPGAMTDIMARALQRGFRLAVHALGNEGVRHALDSYQEARRRTGRDLDGCRLEHAMFGQPRDLERAAAMGLILSMQPGHAVQYARTIRMAGVDRVMDPVPLRTAIDAGCRLAISSDGPTAPGTALDNLRAAVDRITPDGDAIRPDLAITRIEALRAATLGGAEACDVAAVKGSLEPGKQGDFAVLSGDPFDRNTTVLETWIGGVRVHAAGTG